MLRSKGYNVVGLDFLAFEGGAIYSHVMLNPPFAAGAKDTLKAWDMLWRGEIVSIVGAETLRNPSTHERRRLAHLVDEHGSVEFIRDALNGQMPSDRPTRRDRADPPDEDAESTSDWIGAAIDRLPSELALPADFVTT